MTSEEYWDCECANDFIHNKTNGNFCTICGVYEDESPDSRQDEIDELYTIANDNKIIHKG